MMNRTIFLSFKKIKSIDVCGEPALFHMEANVFELPFEIDPTVGAHDFNKCEGCQKNLAELIKRLKEKFEGTESNNGFPFCCPGHSELSKRKGFDRNLFVTVPEMTARKIIYTVNHIKNNHTAENWYKLITNYIDWAVQSFGQMPNDCGGRLFLGEYFKYVIIILKANKVIPAEKKDKLIEFVATCLLPDKKQSVDPIILINTYKEWLTIFPFHLNSYFGSLKEHFEKQIPIFSDTSDVNIYSGTIRAKLHTTESLIEVLVNITNGLLSQINGVALYEKGLITDVNKIKLELVVSSRKLKLNKGYKTESSNKDQYSNMIADWFNDEKKFIEDLTPLLEISSNIKSDDISQNEVTAAPDVTGIADQKPQRKGNNRKKEKFPQITKTLQDYLTEEGKQLLPALIKEYKGSKPSDVAYMWHALNDLTTLISQNIPNTSALHRLLTQAFGEIGTLQPFNQHMTSLKSGRTTYQAEQIAEHAAKIKALK